VSDAPHNLLHRLSKEKPVAIDLLRLLFCVAPEPFPRWVLLDHSESLPAALAEAMGDAESSREILDMLERCSLLRLENPDSLALAPHAADEMGGSLEDSQRRRWCETALGLLYAAFPGDSDDVRTWSVCEQLLPHVLAVLDHVDALGLSDRQATWLLDRAATYLCGKGQYQRAQELIERAIAGARLGTDDPLAGTVRLTSGLLRYALGDFSDARRELERALDLHESARDPEHSDIVKDLVALGSVLWELGETQLAQERLERAVAVGDDAGPATDLSACSARRVLGWILLREGDASGARTLHEHALTLALDLAGADHPEVASARGGLALVLQEQGDLGGAQSELQAAIEIARLVLGPEHPEVAVLRSNLSGVLLGLGDLGQAQRQLELALAAGEAALPANHRGLWIRHSKLASVLRTRGDLQRTREHNERALAVSRRALEWDDPRVATDLGALASTLVALGERSAARECYERARSASAHRYGPEHPDVARYDSLLGQVSRELGDLTGARTHYARALDALKGVRESEAGVAETVRVALAGVLAELADQVSATYTALQQERQAEDLREQTRELLSGMLESVLEKRDIRLLAVAADAWMDAAPDPACAALEGAQSLLSGENDAFRRQIGIGWHRLGRSRRTSGDSEGSVHAFEAALPLLDASPQLQGVTLHDIGDVRRSEGRLPDAARLYRQAAEHKRLAGDNGKASDLATTLLALGETQFEMGEPSAVAEELH
jgi:tetratricopeptide (TPR) repeat protein